MQPSIRSGAIISQIETRLMDSIQETGNTLPTTQENQGIKELINKIDRVVFENWSEGKIKIDFNALENKGLPNRYHFLSAESRATLHAAKNNITAESLTKISKEIVEGLRKKQPLIQLNRRTPQKGIYLENFSWDKVEPILKNAKAVLLPLGSNMKEHGHHLPLNNDWLIAEYLTGRVLDEVAIPALPTMGYGYYPAFVNYPGSINVSQENSQALVSDVCRSIAKHGPKKFYVLNTGISTNWALEPAKVALSKEGITLEYFDCMGLSAEFEKGVAEQPRGSHADEIETSMMLYMTPDVVELSVAKPDLAERKSRGPFTRDPNATTGLYSATGAWGDPTLATVKKGEIVTERQVDKLVSLINEFMKDDFVPAQPNPKYLD